MKQLQKYYSVYLHLYCHSCREKAALSLDLSSYGNALATFHVALLCTCVHYCLYPFFKTIVSPNITGMKNTVAESFYLQIHQVKLTHTQATLR